MGGDPRTYGRRQAREAKRCERKLRRKIKRLEAELLLTKASVGREKAALQRRVEPVLEKMRRDAEGLQKALLATGTTLPPHALIRLDGLTRESGFWGRLRWGIKFAFTGRVV